MTLPIYPQAVRGLTWPVMKAAEWATLVQKAPNFFETRIIQSQNPIWHFTLIYEYLKDNPRDVVAALSPYTDYRFLQGFLMGLQGQFAEFLFDDLYDDTIGMVSQPGSGPSSYPSAFRTNTDFIAGTYVVDNNSTPHVQLVSIGGRTGSTVPAFNTGGGLTISGGVTFQDLGVFSGAFGQQIPLVNDGMPTPTYYSPVQRNFGGQFLEDVTDLNTTVYPLTIWANGVQQSSGANYTLHTGGLAIPGFSFQGDYLTWVTQPTGPITALGQFYFRCRIETDEQDIEQFMQQLWTIGGGSSKSGSGVLKFQSSRIATI